MPRTGVSWLRLMTTCPPPTATPARIIGKMFDATGKSMGPLFYVSEIETASIAIKDTLRSRMAWRDSCVAYAGAA